MLSLQDVALASQSMRVFEKTGAEEILNPFIMLVDRLLSSDGTS
jgi:hypothetical protein